MDTHTIQKMSDSGFPNFLKKILMLCFMCVSTGFLIVASVSCTSIIKFPGISSVIAVYMKSFCVWRKGFRYLFDKEEPYGL